MLGLNEESVLRGQSPGNNLCKKKTKLIVKRIISCSYHDSMSKPPHDQLTDQVNPLSNPPALVRLDDDELWSSSLVWPFLWSFGLLISGVSD